MKKIFKFLLIFFFITNQVLAEDREGFLKKISKHKYSKKVEWINDKTFLTIVDPRATVSHLTEALNYICKQTKKYSLTGIEVQVAKKKTKILKTKKCK